MITFHPVKQFRRN